VVLHNPEEAGKKCRVKNSELKSSEKNLLPKIFYQKKDTSH
jgi:hypothetical protein